MFANVFILYKQAFVYPILSYLLKHYIYQGNKVGDLSRMACRVDF